MKEINRYSKEFKGYPELFEEDREFLIKHQNIKEKLLGKKNIELGHQNFEMYSKYIKNYAKISLSPQDFDDIYNDNNLDERNNKFENIYKMKQK